MGKTRGMEAGRKLRQLTIKPRWAEKKFKPHLGWKKPCAGGGSFIPQLSRAQLIKLGKKCAVFVPDENDEVLTAGSRRNGYAAGGLTFKVVDVSGVPQLVFFKKIKVSERMQALMDRKVLKDMKVL